MKIDEKNYLILILLLMFVLGAHAQKRISFGVTGGIFYGNANVSLDGVEIGTILTIFGFDKDALEVLDGGGFYVGFLADIKLVGDLNIQPELLYANAAGESVIMFPVMLKYYLADSFNIQAGPQLDVVLDVPDDVKDFVDSVGYSLALGAGFDINSRFSIQGRCAIGLNNRIDEAITDSLPTLGPSLRTNILQLGVVYKFN